MSDTRRLKLQRAIRKLDKKRRRAAIEGLWNHALGMTWPEPARLFHLTVDASCMRVRFVRISEEQALEEEAIVAALEAQHGGPFVPPTEGNGQDIAS